jgi:hypothetical protein
MVVRVNDRRRVHDESERDSTREIMEYLLFGTIPANIADIRKALPGIDKIKGGSSAWAPMPDRTFMLIENEDGSADWQEMI